MTGWHNKLTHFFFNKSSYSEIDYVHQLVVDGVLLLAVLVAAFLIYIIIRKLLLRVVTKVVTSTQNTWDNEILQGRLLNWFSLLIPVVLIHRLAPITLRAMSHDEPIFADALQSLAQIVIIILAALCVNSLLNIIERLYRRLEVSRELPIKGILQVIKIIVLIASIIFIISTLIGKSPLILFSGLGAMTAILMLIFKDSILGLVAGIQLSANRLVAQGDWIEMPQFGADGEVLEVALTTVKIRNWDKTITTIPTYSLISDSFKNWRGMQAAGVRRMKRSLILDITSVDFLDDTTYQRVKKINLLKDYLDAKEKELQQWNAEHAGEQPDNINCRALTNLGTFRAYVFEYLKHHPKVAKNETLIVRQLQPNEYGLPLELYLFINDNRWAHYEAIQADIFDHLIPVLKEFGLRVFQRPSDYSTLHSQPEKHQSS